MHTFHSLKLGTEVWISKEGEGKERVGVRKGGLKRKRKQQNSKKICLEEKVWDD